ncbi:MAG: 50S ribosomal protein L15e [Candidatus Woesearchaeota archaeon]|jgi:large subunit ribosomal protein L15e
MALYKYIKEAWKQPKKGLNDLWYERLVQWRTDAPTVRIEHPTRLDRARALGYRAKPGIFMVRQRIGRGGHTRERIQGGRVPRKFGIRMNLEQNYQWICEQRAARAFPNCEVLNSYWVAKDGMNYWYEVIMVDKAHPVILADPSLKWMAKPANRRRVFRGLTSAGKKARGLRSKGLGAEKVRPSKGKAANRKHDKIGFGA